MMNKDTKKDNSKKVTNYKIRCVLYGTNLCKHPDCSGYDDRKCTLWMHHSSKWKSKRVDYCHAHIFYLNINFNYVINFFSFNFSSHFDLVLSKLKHFHLYNKIVHFLHYLHTLFHLNFLCNHKKLYLLIFFQHSFEYNRHFC